MICYLRIKEIQIYGNLYFYIISGGSIDCQRGGLRQTCFGDSIYSQQNASHKGGPGSLPKPQIRLWLLLPYKYIHIYTFLHIVSWLRCAILLFVLKVYIYFKCYIHNLFLTYLSNLWNHNIWQLIMKYVYNRLLKIYRMNHHHIKI